MNSTFSCQAMVLLLWDGICQLDSASLRDGTSKMDWRSYLLAKNLQEAISKATGTS